MCKGRIVIAGKGCPSTTGLDGNADHMSRATAFLQARKVFDEGNADLLHTLNLQPCAEETNTNSADALPSYACRLQQVRRAAAVSIKDRHSPDEASAAAALRARFCRPLSACKRSSISATYLHALQLYISHHICGSAAGDFRELRNKSGKPTIWQPIADALRSDLAKGRYGPGNKLPTEAVLPTALASPATQCAMAVLRGSKKTWLPPGADQKNRCAPWTSGDNGGRGQSVTSRNGRPGLRVPRPVAGGSSSNCCARKPVSAGAPFRDHN
eukprot:CAMPEP_0184432784 /NCGR_PEP_ID=MMETSP0738-20130409/362722_1 /TAXON_ID=385413 /ORGANISM="Thalassiosira miniscula, Strain CCMP1093" /LENGTH=269 /DNA_ID=CAMNT_0026798215 /DNA_START=583 /DNA_END=1391 /DNA_ORIENTATION=-